MSVSIVIPTFNGWDIVSRMIPVLIKETKGIAEIIVVDNGSRDGTVVHLKKLYPSVKVIALQKNVGFAGGVNAGIKSSSSDLICVLNNDCFMSRETLLKMITFLEDHQGLAAIQPIICNKSGEIEQIGYTVDLSRGRARVIRDKNYDFMKWQKEYNPFELGTVYGLSGTCLLIRKDIFTKIGMFDESFHSYLEDVDLFLRLALSGYQYAPCLNTTCVHEHMTTSKKMGSYKERRDMINWIRIIVKNYPAWFIIRHFPTLLIERLRNLSGLIKKIIK